MKFNYVKQEQKKGCVIACAAMVTNQTYKEVARWFAADLDADGVSLSHARAYVCDRGFAVVLTQAFASGDVTASNRRMLRPFADIHILRVLPCVDSEIGHALVMDEAGRIFDPEAAGEQDAESYYFVDQVLGFFCEGRKGK